MHEADLTAHHDMTPAEQLEWIESLRADTATIEFLTLESPEELGADCPWAGLPVESVQGVGPRPGYVNRQPNAWLHRVPYDRTLIRAMRAAGGLFGTSPEGGPGPTGPSRWGHVDVYFLDARGAVIGAVVAHEGLVLTRRPPAGDLRSGAVRK